MFRFDGNGNNIMKHDEGAQYAYAEDGLSKPWRHYRYLEKMFQTRARTDRMISIEPTTVQLTATIENMDTRVLTAVSAATAAGTSCALYNPLDCVRVRWQVAKSAASEGSVLLFAINIVQTEGLMKGLWKPGIGCNVMGMGVSSAIRFGWYEDVRDGLMFSSSAGDRGINKGASHMLGAGLITGSIGYVVTTPFHLMKTIIQAGAGPINITDRPNYSRKLTNFWDGVVSLTKEGGVKNLWRGAVPLGVRGSLFTAGQMLGYDGFKTAAKRHWNISESSCLHMAASVSAAFGASFLSAPADILMTKYMTSHSRSSSPTLSGCMKDIYRSGGGIVGFWKGWPIFFARLVPVMLTFTTLYEQCRYHVGVGFLS